jgi:hypothetical protein
MFFKRAVRMAAINFAKKKIGGKKYFSPKSPKDIIYNIYSKKQTIR